MSGKNPLIYNHKFLHNYLKNNCTDIDMTKYNDAFYNGAKAKYDMDDLIYKYTQFYKDFEYLKLDKFSTLAQCKSFQEMPDVPSEALYYLAYYARIAIYFENHPSYFEYHATLSGLYTPQPSVVLSDTILGLDFDLFFISYLSLTTLFVVIFYFLSLRTSIFRYILSMELLLGFFFFLFTMFAVSSGFYDNILFAIAILIVGAAETVIIFTLFIYRVSLERSASQIISNKDV